MSTARQRVAEFARQWRVKQQLAGRADEIYRVNFDPALDEDAVLTVQDLEEITANDVEPELEAHVLAAYLDIASIEPGAVDFQANVKLPRGELAKMIRMAARSIS